MRGNRKNEFRKNGKNERKLQGIAMPRITRPMKWVPADLGTTLMTVHVRKGNSSVGLRAHVELSGVLQNIIWQNTSSGNVRQCQIEGHAKILGCLFSGALSGLPDLAPARRKTLI